MQGLNGRVLIIPRAKTLALLMFVSLLTVSSLPAIARAETLETGEQTQPVENTVEPPQLVQLLSPPGDRTLVWSWSLPVGGLNPDATQPPEGEAPVPNATDIVQFGYRLTKQGSDTPVVGVVNSDTLGLTTVVTEDGEYSLSVWSITRAENKSPEVVATVTIVTPTPELPSLPPIKEDIIPDPIDTSTLLSKPIVSPGTPSNTNTQKTSKKEGSPINSVTPNVLSATDSQKDVNPIETIAGVQPTRQGWVVLGVPWYVLLPMLVVLYISGRLIYSLVKK